MNEEQLTPEEKERTELLFKVLIDIRNELIRMRGDTRSMKDDIKELRSEIVGDN